MADARHPLRQGKEEAGRRPKVLITDGLQSYNDAVRQEMYTNTDPTLHVRLASIRTHPNNNILERLNGTERERTKVMRAFDNPKSAQILLEGQRVYYNLVRPHMGLGGITPAEAAGIHLDLGDDPLATLIRMAARRKAMPLASHQPPSTGASMEAGTT